MLLDGDGQRVFLVDLLVVTVFPICLGERELYHVPLAAMGGTYALCVEMRLAAAGVASVDDIVVAMRTKSPEPRAQIAVFEWGLTLFGISNNQF